MRTDDLDFQLPPDLIAQSPTPDRAASRLLHYRRDSHAIGHRAFNDLPSLLFPGDLLVFNDAKVLPARFMLKKETGGLVDALFLSQLSPITWHVLLRNLGQYFDRPLHFLEDPALSATAQHHPTPGEYTLTLNTTEPAIQILDRIGRMPLPPYIKREKSHDPRDDFDRQRYQTVYAKSPGSVAAPTAGLHFTPDILRDLENRGIQKTFVTLHVGLGTFKPVSADTLEAHAMHTEAYAISTEAADALNRAKQENRRIIPVGTTAARVLESQRDNEIFEPYHSETNIFIYPPYRWRHVSALITNFHLPRSTLIALVAALTGLDEQRRLYAEAIQNRYRFFSYGDAMFIE